jgi:hypothetical protein
MNKGGTIMFNKTMVFLGTGILIGSWSFALAGQKDAQLLRDAATALKLSNPSLSQKLDAFAIHKIGESEVDAAKEAENESEEKSEEERDRCDQKYVGTLNEAAVALRESKLTLAAQLARLAKENTDVEDNEAEENRLDDREKR